MAASSVGPNGKYDIRLDNASTPTTSVGLILDREENGTPRMREILSNPLPDRQSQGPLSFADTDPGAEFLFSQWDWAGGGFYSVQGSGEGNTYSQAAGVDARHQGVLGLGMLKASAVDFPLIYNGDAESNNTMTFAARSSTLQAAPWLANSTYATASNVTTDPYAGSRHFKISYVSGTSDNSYAAIPFPVDAYLGCQITITFYAKLASAGTVYTQMYLNSTGNNGASVTATSYTQYSITSRTVGANDTVFEFQVLMDSGDPDIYIDNITVTISSGNPSGMRVHGPIRNATNSGGLYAVAANVLAYSSNGTSWSAYWQFPPPVQCTGFALAGSASGGNLTYVFGFPGDNPYWYGVGSGAYTESNLGDPAQYATAFATRRGQLWKYRTDGTNGENSFVAYSTNYKNGGSWSTEYTIGDKAVPITNIYFFNDTVVVGKMDGLYAYNEVADDDTAANTWRNVSSEYRGQIHEDNFALGYEWHGWLYLTTVGTGLVRWNGYQFEELSYLFQDNFSTTAASRVLALLPSGPFLYALVDTATANSIQKSVWLVSIQEQGGRLAAHPLDKLDITTVGAAAGFTASYNLNSTITPSLGAVADKLYVFGLLHNGSNYRARHIAYSLPTNSQAPFTDPDGNIATSGTFETSRWHGGVPHLKKALVEAILWTEDNLDAEHTVVVKYGVDGAAPSTNTWGTLNSSGTTHTLGISDLTNPLTTAIGRSFQFQLTLTTDDTVSPRIYGTNFRFVLRPEDRKVWEVFFWVNVPDRLGLADNRGKTTVLSDLTTLRQQVFPIILAEDLDQDDAETTHYVVVREWERVLEPNTWERKHTVWPEGAELYRAVLQEV